MLYRIIIIIIIIIIVIIIIIIIISSSSSSSCSSSIINLVIIIVILDNNLVVERIIAQSDCTSNIVRTDQITQGALDVLVRFVRCKPFHLDTLFATVKFARICCLYKSYYTKRATLNCRYDRKYLLLCFQKFSMIDLFGLKVILPIQLRLSYWQLLVRLCLFTFPGNNSNLLH